MKIKFFFLIIFSLVCASVFTSCKTSGNAEMNRLYPENYQIFTGITPTGKECLKAILNQTNLNHKAENYL